MSASQYSALFLAYSVALLAALGISWRAPRLWPSGAAPAFPHPWREVAWALVATAAVLSLGVLYFARPALPGDQPASPGAGRYQPDCDLRSLPAAPRATPPGAGNCMATETGHRAPGRHRTGTRSSGAHRLCSRKVRPRGVAAVSRPCLCALARLLPGSSAVGGPQYRDPLCTLPECAWVTLDSSSGGPALCCCPCSWTARERGEHQRLVALDRGRRTRRIGAGAATTIARRMVVLDGSLCARYDTVLRPWNGGLTVLNGVSPRY